MVRDLFTDSADDFADTATTTDTVLSETLRPIVFGNFPLLLFQKSADQWLPQSVDSVWTSMKVSTIEVMGTNVVDG